MAKLIYSLRSGDVLAVWRLDRLGRSLKHLIDLIDKLEGQGIGFHSVTESVDTTTPGGKLVFHIPHLLQIDRVATILTFVEHETGNV